MKNNMQNDPTGNGTQSDSSKARKLYDALRSNRRIKGVPDDYSKFESAMESPEKQQKLHEALLGNSAVKGVPKEFDKFKSAFAELSPSVTETPSPLQPEPEQVPDFRTEVPGMESQQDQQVAGPVQDQDISTEPVETQQPQEKPDRGMADWVERATTGSLSSGGVGIQAGAEGLMDRNVDAEGFKGKNIDFQRMLFDIKEHGKARTMAQMFTETPSRDLRGTVEGLEASRDILLERGDEESVKEAGKLGRYVDRANHEVLSRYFKLREEYDAISNQLGEVNSEVRSGTFAGGLAGTDESRANVKGLMFKKESMEGQLENLQTRIEDLQPKEWEKRVANWGKSAGVAVAETPAGILDGVALASKEIDDLLGTGIQPGDVDEQFTAQLAQKIRVKTQEYLPTDPTLQEEYGTKLAGALGSFLSYSGLGIGAKAMKGLGGTLSTVAAASGGASQSYREAKAMDASEEDARMAGRLGTIPGVIQVLPVLRVMRRVSKAKGRGHVKAFDRAVEALKTGGQEAFVDALGRIGTDWIAKETYDADREIFDEYMDSVTEAGAAGALSDFLMTSVFGRKARQRARNSQQLYESVSIFDATAERKQRLEAWNPKGAEEYTNRVREQKDRRARQSGMGNWNPEGAEKMVGGERQRQHQQQRQREQNDQTLLEGANSSDPLTEGQPQEVVEGGRRDEGYVNPEINFQWNDQAPAQEQTTQLESEKQRLQDVLDEVNENGSPEVAQDAQLAIDMIDEKIAELNGEPAPTGQQGEQTQGKRKPIDASLRQLDEAGDDPVKKLNAINRFDKNIERRPDSATQEEKDRFDSEREALREQGYEMSNKQVLYEGDKAKANQVIPYDGQILTEQQIKHIESHINVREKINAEIDVEDLPSPVKNTFQPEIFKDGELFKRAEVSIIKFESVEQAKEAIARSKQAGETNTGDSGEQESTGSDSAIDMDQGQWVDTLPRVESGQQAEGSSESDFESTGDPQLDASIQRKDALDELGEITNKKKSLNSERNNFILTEEEYKSEIDALDKRREELKKQADDLLNEYDWDSGIGLGNGDYRGTVDPATGELLIINKDGRDIGRSSRNRKELAGEFIAKMPENLNGMSAQYIALREGQEIRNEADFINFSQASERPSDVADAIAMRQEQLDNELSSTLSSPILSIAGNVSPSARNDKNGGIRSPFRVTKDDFDAFSSPSYLEDKYIRNQLDKGTGKAGLDETAEGVSRELNREVTPEELIEAWLDYQYKRQGGISDDNTMSSLTQKFADMTGEPYSSELGEAVSKQTMAAENNLSESAADYAMALLSMDNVDTAGWLDESGNINYDIVTAQVNRLAESDADFAKWLLGEISPEQLRKPESTGQQNESESTESTSTTTSSSGSTGSSGGSGGSGSTSTGSSGSTSEGQTKGSSGSNSGTQSDGRSNEASGTSTQEENGESVSDRGERGSESTVGDNTGNNDGRRGEREYPIPTDGASPNGIRPGLVYASKDQIPEPVELLSTESYPILDENQRFGVNMALTRFNNGGEGFLLADGTGTGKTMQMLVIADQLQKSGKGKVLIVTQNKQIISNFKSDAKLVGVDLSTIEIGTYNDLRTGKVGEGEYYAVLFDEAHNLKNQTSQTAMKANQVDTQHKLFATATPMDTISGSVYFISSVTNMSDADVYDFMGFNRIQKTDKYGRAIPGEYFYQLAEGVTPQIARQRMVELRDQVMADGGMLRREYPHFGEIIETTAPMTPQGTANQNRIDEYWEDQLARAANANGNVSPKVKMSIMGQRSGELSRANEADKLDFMFTTIKNDLKDGKKVVVVAEGVNPSFIKGLDMEVPGFLTEMANRLEAEGIPVAKIFGGGKKDGEVTKFQEGEVDVVLATPQSGGTGINLDDSNGDAPRVLHMVTDNYSGNQFEQVLGRVSRRNTASPADVIIHYNNSISDGRRKVIVSEKIKTLKAIQRGEEIKDDVIEDVGGSSSNPTGKSKGNSMSKNDDAPATDIVKTNQRLEGTGISLRETGKAVVFVGENTRQVKDQLKEIGAKWHRRETGWMFPTSRGDLVSQATDIIKEHFDNAQAESDGSGSIHPIKNDYLGVTSKITQGEVRLKTDNEFVVMILSDSDFATYDESTREWVVEEKYAEELNDLIQETEQQVRDGFRSSTLPIQDSPTEYEGGADYIKPDRKGNTRKGGRLIREIEKDEKGESIGAVSIIEFVNDLVGVEQRIANSQTTNNNPAHFNPVPMIVRSRSKSWGGGNFHEAGHAISRRMKAKNPKWWNQIKSDLIALTSKRGGPGVHASATSAEEGFAEWVRLYIVNPKAVPSNLTRRIERYMEANHKRLLNGLQDAHLAWDAHMSRDVVAQFASYNNDTGKSKYSFKDSLDNFLFNYFSIGHAPYRIKRKIFREVSKLSQDHWQEVKDAFDMSFSDGLNALWDTAKLKVQGIKKAQEVDKKIDDSSADINSALAMFYKVPIDTHFAIHGDSKIKKEGIRITWWNDKQSFGEMFPEDVREVLEQAGYKIPEGDAAFGEQLFLSDKSISAIKKDVGEGKWDLFEMYGFMRESVGRHENKKHEYPGRRDGLTVPKMKAEIARLESENKQFKQAFDDINQYFDQLALLSYISGEKTVIDGYNITRDEDGNEIDREVIPGDLLRIKEGIDTYWPLPRKIPNSVDSEIADKVGKARPSGGIQSATGSDKPIRSLDDSIEARTRKALHAYAWNNVMLTVKRMGEKVSQQDGISIDAKAAAKRLMTPLKLDSKIVATLSPEESAELVAGYLNDALLEQKIEQFMEGELEGVSDAEMSAMYQRMIDGENPKSIVKLTPEEKITPSQINLKMGGKNIWRASEPAIANIVAPFENGQRTFYEVSDPILFDFFTHSKDPGNATQFLFDVINPMTEAWKKVLTQNVVFALWQTLGREQAFHQLTGRGKRRFVPYAFHITGAMNRLVGSSDILQKKFKHYEEASESGYLLSAAFSKTTTDAHKSFYDKFMDTLKDGIVHDDWTEIGIGGKAKKMPGIAMNTVLKPVEMMLYMTGQRTASISLESLAREGEMVAELQRGKSLPTAQDAYDKSGGHFSSYPGSGTLLSALKMMGFGNPTMQVTYQVGQQLTHYDPVKRAASIAAMGSITLSSAVFAAINFLSLDEEDKKNMRERLDDDRMRYQNWGGKMRIPFDYGFTGTAQSYGWNMVEGMLLNEPVEGDALARRIIAVGTELPGHPANFLPPMFKAPIENQVNYNLFYGEPIVPAWMESLYGNTPEFQYYDSTNETYKTIGGWTDISPLKVEHFVKQALSNMMDESISAIEILATDKKLEEMSDTPIIGRMFARESRGYRSKSVRKAMELSDDYQALQLAYNRMAEDPEADPEELRELGQKMRQVYAGHQLYKELRRFQEAIRMERKRRDPDTEHIKNLERRMADVARRVLKQQEEQNQQ